MQLVKVGPKLSKPFVNIIDHKSNLVVDMATTITLRNAVKPLISVLLLILDMASAVTKSVEHNGTVSVHHKLPPLC